jgi:hypothetical protein
MTLHPLSSSLLATVRWIIPVIAAIRYITEYRQSGLDPAVSCGRHEGPVWAGSDNRHEGRKPDFRCE